MINTTDDASLRFVRGANLDSETMRIDSAGRVGIGDTPDVPLMVAKDGTSHTTAAITIKSTQNGGYGSILNFESTNSSGSAVTAAAIGTEGAENYSSSATTSSNLKFSTIHDASFAERMRIPSSGGLLVGCTSAPSASVSGFSILNNAGFCLVNQATTDSGANTCTQFINPNGVVGKIQTSGNGTSFVTSSDYRLKENVDYTWDATTRLKQLKPARFNFITDADTTVDGFLAHEAQAVVPECVTGTKDEVDDDDVAVMQGIDQSKLVPLLVKTLQEALAEIDTLKTKVQALDCLLYTSDAADE